MTHFGYLVDSMLTNRHSAAEFFARLLKEDGVRVTVELDIERDHCEECGKILFNRRSDARFCDKRCRSRRRKKAMNDDTPHVRWMVRRDMPDVLRIDGQCYRPAWTENDLKITLQQKNVIGMVVELNGRIVGYMVYELHSQRLNVMRLAVDREFRRRDVGTAMIRKLVDKLTSVRRSHITLKVSANNLAAHLFLKALGFVAVAVIDDDEECPGEMYSFVYHIDRQTVESRE